MDSATGVLGQTSIDTNDYEPLLFEGEQHGEVHFIRNDDLERGPYRAALWRLRKEELPYYSPYTFECDETFCVLEGELELEFDDGTTVLLGTGDIISVAAGTNSQWRIERPFKKLVVET